MGQEFCVSACGWRFRLSAYKLSLMPGAGKAEVYFVVAMMLLILVVCVVSVWAFFKTYKKEMNEKREREKKRNLAEQESEDK